VTLFYIFCSLSLRGRWVLNGRIINNRTSPHPLADNTIYYIQEKSSRPGGVDADVERWYNLTISSPTDADLGQYICVGENNGGVMERTVVLTFDDPATYVAGSPITHEQMTIIVGVAVAMALLLLLLLLFCCCCLCRGRSTSAKKNRTPMAERNGFAISAAGDSQKLLPNGGGSIVAVVSGNSNPVPKPPREYTGYEVELRDVRVNGGSSGATGTASNSSGCSERAVSLSRASFVDSDQPYPDLLDHHRSGPSLASYATLHHPHHHVGHAASHHHLRAAAMPPSSASPSSGSGGSTVPDHTRLAPQPASSATVLSPANLMLTPRQQAQYAHLVASSPLQRSGTLPLHYNPRSVSCDHTAIPVSLVATPAGTFHVAPLPVVHHHHHQPTGQQGQPNARPGYVTLPRRPRGGWAVPRDTPSPGGASVASSTLGRSHLAEREPIYDGIGPRTSADGSSRLQLSNGKIPPPTSSASSRPSLPPYCAPIAELQEAPPTPKKRNVAAKSTPNMLVDIGGDQDNGILPSSSEATLIEENLSGYCEPFGKAEKPDDSGSQRNSVASAAESELDEVVGKVNGKPTPPKANKDHSVASAGAPKSSTPLRSEEHHPLVNGHRKNGGPPPKTLPKPKVKPVPPPKPKKSFSSADDPSQTPLISFQDEGVDGSEV